MVMVSSGGGGGAVGPAASTGFAGPVSTAASTTATQAGATAIPLGQYFTSITGPTTDVYVRLPAGATIGDEYCVSAANAANSVVPHVYPSTGGIISRLTANTAYNCQAYGRAIFASAGANNWDIIARVPGFADQVGGFYDFTANPTYYGTLSIQGGVQLGQSYGLTATAGGGQASGYSIARSITVAGFSVVASVGDSATLPAPTSETHMIMNRGALAMNLFPHVGSSINGLADNAAISIPAKQSAFCFAVYDGVSVYRWGVTITS